MSTKNKKVEEEETNEPAVAGFGEESAVVKARRERLAKTVGDASEDTDGKTYGVSDRPKREDEKNGK